MIKTPFSRRATTVLSAIAASVLPFAANASDAQSYLLSKGQHFVQTNATSTPVPGPSAKPFEFFSSVEPGSRGAVTNAILKLPDLSNRGMSNLFDAFEFERSFASRADLDTAFPEGQYTFIIDTLNDGRKTPKLTLPTAVYPPVPRVLNFGDLQALETDQPLTLSWTPFVGGTANDYVILDIAQSGNEDNIYFSTPGLLTPDVLNGTNTSVTIPAGTLSYDESYVGRLLFVKRTGLNTNGYPGAVGIAGYFRDTAFPLTALTQPPAEGRFQFNSSVFRTSETNGEAVVTITRSGSQGQASVNFNTVNGTAADGQDYVGANTVLTFNDGVTSTNVAIQILDDATLEGNENLVLSLSSPTGGAIVGPRSNAVLQILDNEIASVGVLAFSAPRFSFAEEGALATLIVNRTGGSNGTITVQYATSEGSAAGGGTDFFSTNGVIGFGPGITQKTIAIRLRDDKLDEFNETFSVILSSPTGGAALGVNASASVSIVDNDVAGSVSFTETAFKARENGGSAVVTVVRSGGTAAGVTVDYSTADNSAVGTQDYVPTAGTLTFAANETSKIISVPISQDLAAEVNERFFVRLSNPTGRATLGVNTNSSVVIADDESSVSFGQAAYIFSETNVSLVIPVIRSGDLNTPVSIGYATEDGTASAGSDYRGTNGVLNFPTNVPTRNVVIPVIRDHVIEDDETLFVTLFNPQGGVQMGSFTNVGITITNDDFAGRFVFTSATYSTPEGTAGSVVVKRAGGLAAGTSVTLQTIAGGTATAVTDYKAVTTNIVFAGGEASKTIRIPTITDVIPEANETVKVRLSNPTGGATLGNVTNATLTIVNKADPNAIPAAGESYMNVTITGVNGNPVNKALNVVNNPVAQETVAASYSAAQKAIQGLTGSKTTVVLSGFTAITTFHVLQLPFLKASSPGVFPIDSSSSAGGAIWTYNTFGGESHTYGTGNPGSSGQVIIDVLDPTAKIITGRFDFVAVQDGGGTAKVRIQGSFRVKNVFVN